MAYTDAKKRFQGTFDAALLFHDGAAAVIADGAGVVEGAARVNAVGSGLFRGVMILDVSALKVSGTDETYAFIVQGSNDDFSSSRNLCGVTLGAATADVPGRYKIHFDNELAGTYFSQLRIYTDVGGTNPSTTFQAYVVQQP